MSAEKSASYSRRNFLNTGGAFLAGGLVGAAAAGSPKARGASKSAVAELPWPWAKIDPMEAGSRAYRYYHDVGG